LVDHRHLALVYVLGTATRTVLNDSNGIFVQNGAWLIPERRLPDWI
jgi:hypothetical protein